MSEFSESIDQLSELTQSGLAEVDETLQEIIVELSRLGELAENCLTDFHDDDASVVELVDFVVDSCRVLREAALSGSAVNLDEEQFDVLRAEIEHRLETHQESFSSAPEFDLEQTREDGWCDSDCSQEDSDQELVAPSQEEIAALLNGLNSQHVSKSGEDHSANVHRQQQQPSGNESSSSNPSQETKAPAATIGTSGISVPELDHIELDEELREAFMDDASRGLESMEQALLDLESSPGGSEPVTVIGRELHTIKGASASIGMSHLASYIHEVEELIRRTQSEGQPITPDLLLAHVDLIRARVEGNDDPVENEIPASKTSIRAAQVGPDNPSQLSTAGPSQNPAVATQSAPIAKKSSPLNLADSHGDDETVRVKSSQLNRLMDMLSELVMLRNQRDTEISELKGIHDELIHSVTRIRMLSHEGEALLASDQLTNPHLAEEGVSFSHLNEVANDVLESAQRLHECYRPVAEGNQAVSQFIRNFRMELVQLRRMPVSGLFRRLHRAISDAARAEDKQVRVELRGENTGIERSLQERIFEPLLHIVRNSVSHGIESPDDRQAAGKSAAGTVTLHAHSGPDLLVIEVRDDGKGLDYDAIRRRGIERGLIDADRSISRAELSRLIFHPGFSTRETASEISGRGVGMDVVASTLERMRGWVEVESETGCGSTIRLSLPLPSMIQHAMLFRSGGQLFALPAQSIRRTGAYDPSAEPIDLNQLLSIGDPQNPEQCDPSQRPMIEIANGATSTENQIGRQFALLVDRVLGPEEVVVRPMPPMLKSHPLCTGATLSGMGEVVLLLDPRQLSEARRGVRSVGTPSQAVERIAAQEQAKVLVVDDSKSARLRVARALQKYPVQVVQVEDGQAAMELLAKETFATVFSDIDMPRMSGLELLETIKQEPRLEPIPVIMISSRSTETAGVQATKLGAQAYMQKPLSVEHFDEVVGNLPWATA